MNISVLKFGGSTFQMLTDYNRVAAHLAVRTREEKLVVVVSGIEGMTERLRAMAGAIHPTVSDRTAAALLPLADSVSTQLLCHALEAEGVAAVGLMGAEIGVVTDETWSRARVLDLNAGSLCKALKNHSIVTIPGGQAATGSGRQSWLGKNSSDYSAVMVAKMLGARACEIYSDTPGIYSCDPALVEGVRLIPELPYAQVVELAHSGAKVLHYDAVRCAQEADIELVCRRNHGAYEAGTWIGRGRPANLVCPDMRSKVLAFAGPRAQQRAQDVLTARNLPVVALKGLLAVTCGHSEPERYLAEAGLEFTRKEEVLITTLSCEGGIARELAEKTRARERAQEIHDGLYGHAALNER